MKYNENDKIIVANIYLKNNKGVLNDCVIFKDIYQKGQLSVQDKETIKQLLSGELVELIMIQNGYMNATLCTKHIEKYEIKEIRMGDF